MVNLLARLYVITFFAENYTQGRRRLKRFYLTTKIETTEIDSEEKSTSKRFGRHSKICSKFEQ